MIATGARKIRRGRVTMVAVVLLICAVYMGWRMLMTRSVTIRLEPAGYDLTYTMAWGMGMEQKLTLSKVGGVFEQASSDWIEIWKKPYNSGLSIYRSRNGSRYYFGSVYRLFVFETVSGALSSYCHPDAAPPRTDLGKQLEFYNSHEARESADPGGRDLFAYVEEDELSGSVSENPPPSRYYADLDYLGRFGLVRSEGRGHRIRFVPAPFAAEPQNSLYSRCG